MTSLETSLTAALYALDCPIQDRSSPGSLLLEEFFPTLLENAPVGPQFMELRQQVAKHARGSIVYLQAAQRARVSIGKSAVEATSTRAFEEKRLFEVVDVFIDPPSGPHFMQRPTLTLTALAGEWYIDGGAENIARQPYDVKRMVTRVVDTLRSQPPRTYNTHPLPEIE